MNMVDKDGRTLLHTTASPKLMAALLEAGGNPNVADQKGNSPLHLAKSPELVAALLAAGADLNVANKVGCGIGLLVRTHHRTYHNNHYRKLPR